MKSCVLLCLMFCVMCAACQAPPSPPPPQMSTVRQPQEIEQATKEQERRKKQEDLLQKLRAEQAERDRQSQEGSHDFLDILHKCGKQTMPYEECAERLIAHREKYRVVMTKQQNSLMAAMLTRYLYEAHRYDESVKEGRKYLDSGTTDEGILPAVLLYKALSHDRLEQRGEADYLLKYVTL